MEPGEAAWDDEPEAPDPPEDEEGSAAGEGLGNGAASVFKTEEGGRPGVGVAVAPLLSDDEVSDDLASPLPEGGEVEFVESDETRSVGELEASVFEPTGGDADSVGVVPSGVVFGVSVGRGVVGTPADEPEGSPPFVDGPFGTVGVGVGETGPGVGVTGVGVGVGETGPGVGVGVTGPGVGEGVTEVGVGVGVGETGPGVGVGETGPGVGVGVTGVGVSGVGVGVTGAGVGVGDGVTGPTG